MFDYNLSVFIEVIGP